MMSKSRRVRMCLLGAYAVEPEVPPQLLYFGCDLRSRHTFPSDYTAMMTHTSQEHPPSMGTDICNASLEWNRVERIRLNQRRRVAQLKEKQRLAEMNKWSARNSSSVRKQVEVRQALREWFEAVRSDSGGVHGAQLVDAVITLGLNHDLKQVQRTVAAEADTADGLLLSPKSFTAALLACCDSDLERERLFRSLRGEGEWRRYGGDGHGASNERRKGGPPPKATNAVAESITAAGVPAFITQLTSYRRRVLIATVADRFPTPCTTSFWTPDAEGRQQQQRQQQHQQPQLPEALASTLAKESSAAKNATPAIVSPSASDSSKFGVGVDVDRTVSSVTNPETTAETGGPTTAPLMSVETRKRYDAVAEAVFLAMERGRDQLQPPTPTAATSPGSPSPDNRFAGSVPQSDPRKARTSLVDDGKATASKETKTSTAGRRPRTSTAREGSVGDKATRHPATANIVRQSVSRESGGRPRGRARTTSSGGGRNPNELSRTSTEHSLLDTAARLRDSLHRKELNTTAMEARWDNYRVMKKRWWRRTPVSILQDDGLDEADRSYSRLSRPRTIEVVYSCSFALPSPIDSRWPHKAIDVFMKKAHSQTGAATTTPKRTDKQALDVPRDRRKSALIRVSNPCLHRRANTKGTGSERHLFAECGTGTLSSGCRRPSTAPAGQFLSPQLVAQGTTSFSSIDRTCLTGGGGGDSIDTNRGGASGAGRRRWQSKPLPLGPIPLNEGKKLRYPLLQLKREKLRAQSARGKRSVGGEDTDRERISPRQGSYVDVPVTTDWKGRWQPHLSRVPCRLEPGRS